MGRRRGYQLARVEAALDYSILTATRFRRLLTLREAALASGRPLGTWYRRVAQNQVPSLKSPDGRRWVAGETVLLLRDLRYRHLRRATNVRTDMIRRIIDRPFLTKPPAKSIDEVGPTL